MSEPTTRPIRSRSVTLQDIATRCGVTKTAVAMALRGDKQVSQPVADRIRAMAAELGYDPQQHMAARRLAMRRHGIDLPNRVICAALPKLFQQARYFLEISRGIFDVLEEARYSLLTSYIQFLTEDTATTNMPLPVARGEVDGVIAVPVGPDIIDMMHVLQNTKALQSHPVVTVMHQVPGYPSILTDDQQGAYDAAIHLLDLGHRHIVQFITEEFNANMDRRLAGIRKAFSDRGIPEGNLSTFVINFDWLNPYTLLEDIAEGNSERWEQDKTRASLTAFMQEHREVTAILAFNDVSAARAWYALQGNGIQIPDDISIVGFDDTDPKVDEFGRNQLTTVRIPLAEAGRVAARYLIHRIQHEQVQLDTHVLPTELIVRGSTAPAVTRK
ncbi:MAG TPA: LacI family DNA-binding transcriptional regulator [Armatimonadota bacterium]|nr:LacI family DNA-binding transcriptional regulator [Armatimonadota bacterium]